MALKTCKTQTGALLSLCWAKQHGMDLMVQDLTNPMLAVSSNGLGFDYTYDPEEPIAVQEQPLTLTNNTSLPLAFDLRSQVPFSLDSWSHNLLPGDST